MKFHPPPLKFSFLCALLLVPSELSSFVHMLTWTHKSKALPTQTSRILSLQITGAGLLNILNMR